MNIELQKVYHNIIKQYAFVHVGPVNIIMGCSNQVQI